MWRLNSFLLLLACLPCLGQPLSPHDPAMMTSSSSLRKGLVGYWRMEELTGTRYDRSPSGNHLLSSNSVGQAVGVVGNCAYFTKFSTPYLNLPSNATLQGANRDLFIACWVKLTTKTTTQQIVTKFGASITNRCEYALLYVPSATDRFEFIISTNNAGGTLTAVANNFGAPSIGVWYFICAWWDQTAGTVNISVNNGTANSTSGPKAIGSTGAAFMVGWRETLPSNESLDGYVDELGLWRRVLTTAEKSQLYRGGLGVTHPRFQASQPCNVLIAFEGDSITAELSADTVKYPYAAVQSINAHLAYLNFAVSGSTLTDLNNRATMVDAAYTPSKTCVLSVLIGANDLFASGDTNAFVAGLKTYCNARKSAGWKVVVCTIISDCSANVNTRRAPVNGAIRADNSFYDALADFGGDAIMGADATCSNTTYFSDGVHPTAAGYTILAPLSSASISSLLPPLMGCAVEGPLAYLVATGDLWQ